MQCLSHGNYTSTIYSLFYGIYTYLIKSIFTSMDWVLCKFPFWFPSYHDSKPYHDATPSLSKNHHKLNSFRNACWVSEAKKSVEYITGLDRFKLWFIIISVIIRCGSPVLCKDFFQKRNTILSYESKIMVTDKGAKYFSPPLTLLLWHQFSVYQCPDHPLQLKPRIRLQVKSWHYRS